MSSAALTSEAEELSTRVLGIIGAYGMGTAVDAEALNVKNSHVEATEAELVSASGGNSREQRPRNHRES